MIRVSNMTASLSVVGSILVSTSQVQTQVIKRNEKL